MFHRETDAAKVARNRDAIFDLHAASLEWLERYTGIAYPFGKFDFLLVPSFQFGGMEHAGAIFYNAAGLLLDQSATQNQLLGRASVIAHETSHMWFGDLVTMRWFNDVWMKEVFANFMAAKIVNPSFPEINHELRFLLTYYPAAYEVDRTAGTNAIRQRLDNLDEAGTLYGAIIYQKAPIVMRQLEMILGEDGFRDGLREYLGAHSFANATWADLIRVLDARTPEDLETWSHAWIEEAGRPVITTDLRVEDGRIARLALVQRDPAPRRGLVWTERMQMALGYDDEIRRIPVSLSAARVEVAGCARPAGAALCAADRRRSRLWRVRPRSGDPRLPADPSAGHSGRAHTRQRHRHALGRDAGRPGTAGGRRRRPGPRLAARARRAEPAADARLRAAGILEVSPRRPHGTRSRRSSSACCAKASTPPRPPA